MTVPRGVQRKRGEIARPSLWEQYALRVPAAGDPAKHFTIPAHGITVFESSDAFIAVVRKLMAEAGEFKDHAIVFVHGYRVTFEDALYRTAQITYDLGTDNGPFGTAFLYSWPSSGDLRGYKYDSDSARLAVEHVQSFFELVLNKSGAKYVHFIGHSMGSWPLLAAIDQIAKATAEDQAAKKPAKPPVVNQVILAAPDIDSAEFLKLAANIARVAKGVTLYASSNDYAMLASREVHRGAPRAGDIPIRGRPVIAKGIDTIDVSALSTDVFALGHAGYADRRELLNDIGLILRKGERPPHLRMPILERVHWKDQVYWKYPY